MKYNKFIFVIVIIIILLVLIQRNKVTTSFISENIIDNEAYIHNKIINQKECENIIKIGNKYPYDIDEEIVDKKPLYQIDIFTDKNNIVNKELWGFIEPIYKNKIIPLVNQFTKNKKVELDFLFFRKYNSKERKDISIHTDDNYLSVNILLSNKKSYKGGEFYIFNNKFTKKYMNYYEKKLENNENKKLEFINSFEKLPIANMSQGDIIFYTGKNHLHGVLPVNTGTRYILSFFFELKN